MRNLIEEVKQKLHRYPEIRFQETANSLSVLPENDQGFPITLEARPAAWSVYFAGWHEEFTDPEQALACIDFGLSDRCRLKVYSRGREDHRWIVEYREGNEWREESEVGLLVTRFWQRSTVRYLQNRTFTDAGDDTGRELR